MTSLPQRPHSRLNRAQVHTALGKVQLTPAVRGLANKLLALLQEDGSASVQALHAELFPLAGAAASASAQLSRLTSTIAAAAAKAGLAISTEFEGEKKAGVAARTLWLVGPRSASQADTEGLDAIPPAQLISGQQGLAITSTRPVVLLTFNVHELNAVLKAFAPAGPAQQ